MDFAEFLFYKKLEVKEVAPELKIHKSYLSSMLSGKRPWSKKVCREIEAYTNGVVKAVDLEGKLQGEIDLDRDILQE